MVIIVIPVWMLLCGCLLTYSDFEMYLKAIYYNYGLVLLCILSKLISFTPKKSRDMPRAYSSDDVHYLCFIMSPVLVHGHKNSTPKVCQPG